MSRELTHRVAYDAGTNAYRVTTVDRFGGAEVARGVDFLMAVLACGLGPVVAAIDAATPRRCQRYEPPPPGAPATSPISWGSGQRRRKRRPAPPPPPMPKRTGGVVVVNTNRPPDLSRLAELARRAEREAATMKGGQQP